MELTKKRSFTLQCPMPKLDFDIITLGHGSGGILTHKLLDKGIYAILEDVLTASRHDGIVLEVGEKLAFTTDSFVVSPVFFPGGNIGDLAINGTVNDLAMCGARPRYLSLSFIIEEGLAVEEFWEILQSIRLACLEAGVQIVTGDTKVVEKGSGDKIFINTSGIGVLHPKAEIALSRVAVGDRIVLSGPVAAHGVAVMSRRPGLEFETTVRSDTRPLHRAVEALLDVHGVAIHLLRDPTRGGVATTLNEIARDAGVGIQLEQDAIPIDEDVKGACELLGLDPLYVANEGVFVAIVSGDAAEDVVETLHGLEEGRRAAIVGEVVEEHPGKVVLRSGIGGTRVVNMLAGAQLPRIC